MYVAAGVPVIFLAAPGPGQTSPWAGLAGQEAAEALIGPFPGAARLWHYAPDSLDEHW